MKRYRSVPLLKLRVALTILTIGGAIFAGLNGGSVPATVGSAGEAPSPTPRRRAAASPRPPKYSQFPHDVKAHRNACNTCHKFPSDNWEKVRPAGAAFPDITEYPKHESCLSCHRPQFFSGAKPAICSICHTNPSPRNSARHPFPNPREAFDTSVKGKNAISDFAVSFPHDKHVEIVAEHRPNTEVHYANAAWARSRPRAEESCAVCHQTYKPQDKSDDEYLTKPPAKLGDGFWMKKGTFKTSPIGHTTCFTCHSADSGMSPAPTDCAVCHKLRQTESAGDHDAKRLLTMQVDDKIIKNAWSSRHSSGTFRHEWFSHAEASCSTCHNVNTIVTTDPASKKVSVAACAACHATATVDEGGALNFEIEARKANAGFQCVKCHVSFGKLPVPDSHIKAIAGGK